MCKAHLTGVSLKREGSKLLIELNMLFICERVHHESSLLFTPSLKSADQSIELPIVIVAGSKRYWSLILAFWGFRHDVFKSYNIRKVFKAINRRSICYSYAVSLAYEEWMSEAQVCLFQA